jgi:hypothetical protein
MHKRSLLRFLVTLSLILLATALGGAPKAIVPDTSESCNGSFLGMAVAANVGEDDNGLRVLKGIHHTLRANTLPASEDVQVYTRWTGTGSHTIGVSFLDPDTDESLAKDSIDVDFGKNSVTSCTHDFTDLSFPASGTYAVEVTLDGACAAEFAFYVNVDGMYPAQPEFVLSVPAETGSVNGKGEASISGIFEHFAFDSFPATESFSIVSLWFSGKGSYDYSVRIVDPQGKTLASSPGGPLKAAYGEMSEATATFHNLRFPAAGMYSATVSLNGQQVFDFPLEITKQ